MHPRHSQYNSRSVCKVIYDYLQQANYSFTLTTKILQPRVTCTKSKMSGNEAHFTYIVDWLVLHRDSHCWYVISIQLPAYWLNG